MKGSQLFWGLVTPIGLIWLGYYLVITDIMPLCGVIAFTVIGFTVWEVHTGMTRDIEDTEYNANGDIHWYHISIIWAIYVGVKYYINPILDKYIRII